MLKILHFATQFKLIFEAFFQALMTVLQIAIAPIAVYFTEKCTYLVWEPINLAEIKKKKEKL